MFGSLEKFPLGVELVSTRGAMSHKHTVKVREFGEVLTHSPLVDWVSITDNAGGNPQMAPMALGTPILYAGKEVVIHLTCKDLNRHGLESQLWLLSSQGFHNLLAMTGDYPMHTFHGRAKPVFDIDSVALLAMIRRMNEGVEIDGRNAGISRRLDGTHFFAGAVTNSFKAQENTLLPQYYKLEKKIEAGAKFIINQIGFDSRKAQELLAYMDWRGFGNVPLIGNVYLLSPFVAGLFHDQKIPGVVLSDALYEVCRKQSKSPDKGKSFFLEFAAKQIAIYRGLGYSGAYLGGVHSSSDLERILSIEKAFAPDDWRVFAREISFSRPGEFYFFESDGESGLCSPGRVNPELRKSLQSRQRTKNVTFGYALSKAFHKLMFERGHGLANIGAAICATRDERLDVPGWLRTIERVSKSLLYQCRDCGDCSLAETAFLCPESQCAKNQRNGPCGGTRGGLCEVHDYECIWARAYDRMKADGRSEELLSHAPVVQNQGLRDSSAWANFWLGRDHTNSTNKKE